MSRTKGKGTQEGETRKQAREAQEGPGRGVGSSEERGADEEQQPWGSGADQGLELAWEGCTAHSTFELWLSIL